MVGACRVGTPAQFAIKSIYLNYLTVNVIGAHGGTMGGACRVGTPAQFAMKSIYLNYLTVCVIGAHGVKPARCISSSLAFNAAASPPAL